MPARSGLSTGLEYDPASTPRRDEVLALAKVAGDARRPLHQPHAQRGPLVLGRARRADRDRPRRTRCRCRCRTSSSACTICGDRLKSRSACSTAARRSGVQLTADIYPYTTGSRTSACSTQSATSADDDRDRVRPRARVAGRRHHLQQLPRDIPITSARRWRRSRHCGAARLRQDR